MEPSYIPQVDASSLSFGDLSLGQGFLQGLFYISTLAAIVYTIILFMHWKKYAPEPVKIFMYSLVYLIGTGSLILIQIILLATY